MPQEKIVCSYRFFSQIISCRAIKTFSLLMKRDLWKKKRRIISSFFSLMKNSMIKGIEISVSSDQIKWKGESFLFENSNRFDLNESVWSFSSRRSIQSEWYEHSMTDFTFLNNELHSISILIDNDSFSFSNRKSDKLHCWIDLWIVSKIFIELVRVTCHLRIDHLIDCFVSRRMFYHELQYSCWHSFFLSTSSFE